jgi:hypothetical protein
VGNVINLIVLSSKELRINSRGHRVSQRSKSMFSYMKALAITDLLYLMMTIEGSIFTLLVKRGLQLKDFDSHPQQKLSIFHNININKLLIAIPFHCTIIPPPRPPPPKKKSLPFFGFYYRDILE